MFGRNKDRGFYLSDPESGSSLKLMMVHVPPEKLSELFSEMARRLGQTVEVVLYSTHHIEPYRRRFYELLAGFHCSSKERRQAQNKFGSVLEYQIWQRDAVDTDFLMKTLMRSRLLFLNDSHCEIQVSGVAEGNLDEKTPAFIKLLSERYLHVFDVDFGPYYPLLRRFRLKSDPNFGEREPFLGRGFLERAHGSYQQEFQALVRRLDAEWQGGLSRRTLLGMEPLSIKQLFREPSSLHRFLREVS